MVLPICEQPGKMFKQFASALYYQAATASTYQIKFSLRSTKLNGLKLSLNLSAGGFHPDPELLICSFMPLELLAPFECTQLTISCVDKKKTS